MKKAIAMLLVLLLAAGGALGSIQPSFASSQTLEVASDALNYRSAPWGTVLGTVYRGQTFTVLGQQLDSSSDIWYRIDKGWVHGDFVNVSGSDSPADPVGKMSVDTDVLNVRDGIWGSWIGELARGDVIDYYATGKDSSGNLWYQIAFGSGSGWVHGDYVRVTSQTPAPAPAPTGQTCAVNSDVLNVRDGVWGNWIGSAYKGQSYSILSSAKDSSGDTWYKIPYGSGSGWIHGKFVTVSGTAPAPSDPDSPADVSYGTVNSAVLNVRSDVWGSWVGEVYQGSKYQLLASKKDSSGDAWYQIVYSGSSKGWVHGGYLTIQTVPGASATAALTIRANTPHYAGSDLTLSASQTGHTNPLYRFSVLEGSTWRVIKDYSASASAIAAPKAGTIKYKVEVKNSGGTRVTSATASIDVISRSVTGIDVILSSLEYSEGVPLLITASAFGSPEPLYEISLNSGSGWKVIKKYSAENSVAFTPAAAGTVTVRVRAKDRYSSNDNEKVFEQAAVLKKGLAPHSYTNTYYGSLEEFARAQVGGAQISSGGYWVDATYSQILKELDPRVILSGAYQSAHPGFDSVLAKSASGYGVNLRKSMWGDVVVTVADGTELPLLGTGNDTDGALWYKVNYQSQTLWIKASFASPKTNVTTSAPTVLGNFAMINTTSLNLRSGPGTDYEALRQVTRGNVYNILAVSGDWLKIKADSTQGWIHKGYVVLTDKVNQNMYQFLDLRGSTEVSAQELNKVLRGKGSLDGMGAAFVEAAKTYGVNEMYLISHALLETGNGTSVLAKGSVYKKADGTSVTVYNMYGIGAYDSDPIGLGTKTAYNEGWTTPYKAIVGGAEWIANDYVNNASGQNTIYKMRWNYNNIYHQYATDVAWARKQVSNISKLYDQVQGYKMRFEIPVYLY